MATEAAFAAVPQASDPEASEATSPAEAVTLASADEEQTEVNNWIILMFLWFLTL